MAELPEELDGDQAEERKNWIDAGTYNVVVINSNLKEPNDKGVQQIGLQLQVIDGPKENATFWLSFNFVNPGSIQNQDISRNQLKLIAKCVGVGMFKNTEDLHDKPFTIGVTVKESGGYTNNNISNIKPYENGGGEEKPEPKTTAKTPNKAATTTSKPGGTAPKGDGKKPWEKNKK